MLRCRSATRTQVYLTAELRRRIPRVTRAEGVTNAEIVRRESSTWPGRVMLVAQRLRTPGMSSGPGGHQCSQVTGGHPSLHRATGRSKDLAPPDSRSRERSYLEENLAAREDGEQERLLAAFRVSRQRPVGPPDSVGLVYDGDHDARRVHAEPSQTQDARDQSTFGDPVRRSDDTQPGAPVNLPPEQVRGSTLELSPAMSNNSMLGDVVIAAGQGVSERLPDFWVSHGGRYSHGPHGTDPLRTNQ